MWVLRICSLPSYVSTNVRGLFTLYWASYVNLFAHWIVLKRYWYVFILRFIHPHWNGTGSWNLFSWETYSIVMPWISWEKVLNTFDTWCQYPEIFFSETFWWIYTKLIYLHVCCTEDMKILPWTKSSLVSFIHACWGYGFRVWIQCMPRIIHRDHVSCVLLLFGYSWFYPYSSW